MEQGYLKSDKPIGPPPYKSTHGNCCTCPNCHYLHDECVCENNRLLAEINKLYKQINQYVDVDKYYKE